MTTKRAREEWEFRIAAERAYATARAEIFDAPGYRSDADLTPVNAAILLSLLEAEAALPGFRSEMRDRTMDNARASEPASD